MRESEARKYFVRQETAGIYVTDTRTQQRFFWVGNQWFWLTGQGNPFDEDVILPSETAEYLSKIVEAAKNAGPDILFEK